MPHRTARTIPTALVVLSGVLFVTTMAALVILIINGDDTEAVESIAKPLLTGLVLSGVVGAVQQSQTGRLDTQDKQLRKIREQTNGVLDARIKEQTKAALLELAAEEEEPYRRRSGSLSDG